MPAYTYRARNQKGQEVTGNVEAASREALARQLREQGYYVASISTSEKKARKEIDLGFLFFWKKAMGTKELSRFSEQFSVMISAGLTLLDSLEIMRDQTENAGLAEVLDQVIDDIEAGENLSNALLKHTDYFPHFSVF